jgi:hypothetical protein
VKTVPQPKEVAVLMATIAGKIATGQIPHSDLRAARQYIDAMLTPAPSRGTSRVTSTGRTLAVVA